MCPKCGVGRIKNVMGLKVGYEGKHIWNVRGFCHRTAKFTNYLAFQCQNGCGSITIPIQHDITDDQRDTCWVIRRVMLASTIERLIERVEAGDRRGSTTMVSPSFELLCSLVDVVLASHTEEEKIGVSFAVFDRQRYSDLVPG